MPFEDKTLTCVECHTSFPFTGRDQEFYASKGFTNEPRRCPACRRTRKAQRGDVLPAAGAPRGGDAGTQAPPVAQAHRSRSEPVRTSEAAPRRSSAEETGRSYTAVCNACGGPATLSVEPAGNRAVLCEACYAKIGAFA